MRWDFYQYTKMVRQWGYPLQHTGLMRVFKTGKARPGTLHFRKELPYHSVSHTIIPAYHLNNLFTMGCS